MTTPSQSKNFNNFYTFIIQKKVRKYQFILRTFF